MCEFKVLIKNEEVYDDVVYAKLEGETIILKDVLGIRKTISSAIIEEVDVQSETLKLKRSSIVGKLLAFLSRYDELASRGVYSEEIEELWEEIKGEGEAMVKKLWVLTHK
jgi:predicted RNA-binding protein